MADIDLLALVSQDAQLQKVATTKGGEWAGPCALCGGRDRLRVWPEYEGGQWWCRQCGKGGDAIAYLVERGDLDKLGAAWARDPFALTEDGEPVKDPVAWLVEHGHWTGAAAAILAPGGTVGAITTPPRRGPAPGPRHADTLAPPPQEWQNTARAFVADCQAVLWSDAGQQALDWLRGRGLLDNTIRAAGLGYNPTDRREKRAAWGLGEGKPVWLPSGIVIPWEIGGELWRVNIRRGRRPRGESKYCGPAGFANGLYNADALATDKPAILVEGEIDALTLGQVAGDLVAPVATGSTGGARRPRWIAALALCPLVLVAFDADEAGSKAAAWWVGVLSNAQRWRPLWADANAMAQDGADLRAWLLAALDLETRLDRVAAAFDDQEQRLARLQGAHQAGATKETGGNGADPGPGGFVESDPAAWEGRRVKLEDLPDFRARWGLVTVGSEWPEGERCPTLYLGEG